MFKGIVNHFWSVFIFPMALNQWIPISISSSRLPEVTVTESSWKIVTHNTVGGYAQLLQAPIASESKDVQLSWEWRVLKFPNTSPAIPFDKHSDDYALRIGVLFENEASSMRLPSGFRSLLSEKKHKLSYVVFYCAVQKVQGSQKCGISPYNDHIINCPIEARGEKKTVEVRPFPDVAKYFTLSDKEVQKLKMIGIWLFADSDNSHSQSEAFLSNLRINNGNK